MLALAAGIAWQRVDEVLAEVELTAAASRPVRTYSLGMRQRLGLAAALMVRPRVLVLDEPANGLDPAGKHHVHRVIRRLADDGVAIVLSSHRMDDLAALCSEVTILATGRVGWEQARQAAAVSASGERADLSGLLPLLG